MLMLGIVDEKRLRALDWSHATLRQRANEAPLPQYLWSRHHAGCTGEELVSSMRATLQLADLSELAVCEDFVPCKDIEAPIVDYLSEKFRQGYIVIATLNLQLVGNDAWHHQVVYGVETEKRLLYCTNPQGSYDEDMATQFLTTPSVLLVRKEDIVSRYSRAGGDETIYDIAGWHEIGVREQVEEVMKGKSARDFVVIPAAYVGGFALFKKNLYMD